MIKGCSKNAKNPILKPSLRDNFLETSPPPSPETGSVGGSIRVVGLYVFPVKSCGGSSLTSSSVSSAGLEFDRQWMLMQGRTVLTQVWLDLLPRSPSLFISCKAEIAPMKDKIFP